MVLTGQPSECTNKTGTFEPPSTITSLWWRLGSEDKYNYVYHLMLRIGQSHSWQYDMTDNNYWWFVSLCCCRLYSTSDHLLQFELWSSTPEFEVGYQILFFTLDLWYRELLLILLSKTIMSEFHKITGSNEWWCVNSQGVKMLLTP